jgi:hypothetical protein
MTHPATLVEAAVQFATILGILSRPEQDRHLIGRGERELET